MEILGIGPFELIIILILALAVFGPDKLPEIGAKLGRSMRQMRKATREFSRELEKARQALDPDQQISQPLEEIKEVAKDATALAMAARDPGRAIRDSVMRELATPPAEPARQDTADETQGTPHSGAEDKTEQTSHPGTDLRSGITEGGPAPGSDVQASGASPDVRVSGASPDVRDETQWTPHLGAEDETGQTPHLGAADETGRTPHPDAGDKDPLTGREA
ncbi:MAG: twin-arginine translocase TatA/TatE family subunit [Anaerolineae bacterium]|nr:twin-arginine translocase TatA/TatE family subunit [Anaerolineae bacterium]